MAPQSLTVAVRTRRRVVAITWKPGYSARTRSIIALNESTGRVDRLASVPSTSNPRLAVKSSSLPIMTSTRPASSRLTSRALARPPFDLHSDGR